MAISYLGMFLVSPFLREKKESLRVLACKEMGYCTGEADLGNTLRWQLLMEYEK